MSKQYEVVLATGQSVYVTHATRHSYNNDRRELQLTDAEYREVAVFFAPQGFVVTDTGTPAPVTPLPGDTIPF